jgi:hypothetical protein
MAILEGAPVGGAASGAASSEPSACAIAHVHLAAHSVLGAKAPAAAVAAAGNGRASLALPGPILAVCAGVGVEFTPASAVVAPEPGTKVASGQVARASRRDPEPVDEEGQVGWVTCSPERPVMEILFRCIEAGRRYYAVRLNGQEIFVGTRPECDRFLAIHNEKVALEQAEARRTPRGRPAALHIYRTARA